MSFFREVQEGNADDGGGEKIKTSLGVKKSINILTSRYIKNHLKEKKEFEKEKRKIFRYLLQYHYISLQLMMETNLYRGKELKSIYEIDSSNLYLLALKYQKQRLYLKLMYFMTELNYYSDILQLLDSNHIHAESTLMSLVERKIKAHEIMSHTND
ncbi:predicted protein [Naegleria gruberi]|uniref:Predicted protein n=1 Tax=Naegleria gruberi TaxID=5762 RepID=D2VV66_NAEGR|nr:uncharacterized protein NAEGRDRAFT_72907 [Naegleria gruberi]EFC39182.1 predicted protein [Naegleria gruberi]|eukprot:XP_002671926.1 predicted protein [Naegleria gruberi strain NEG-M]